jgi:2-oxoglutarate dehydrogenase E1 component
MSSATLPLPATAVLDAYRRWGHFAAALDPLGRLTPLAHPELPREGEAAAHARAIYCGSIGAEFMHLPEPARRDWVAARLEAPAPPVDRRRILSELVRAETLEQSIQARYTGYKRFSLEGVTALIPFLTHLLDEAAEDGAESAVLAMSHRGRLNVLVHVVGRDPLEIFAGFEEHDPKSVLGSGDVKYHLGATGVWRTPSGKEVKLHLSSNPSHLEVVCPVAMGRTRAKQVRLGDPTGRRALAVLMHGDSAFAGQGIAAEALNFVALDGFSIGGAIHVVVNNYIGFTTEPHAYSSTRYATDIAKRLPIPIFHVNAEDPDAVVRVARLAVEYRTAFASDVVVDLLGYRRYGHSEVDDPTVTQPLLYKKIRATPPLWQSYAGRAGLSREEADRAAGAVREEYVAAQKEAAQLSRIPVLRELPGYWAAYRGGRWDDSLAVSTGVAPARLGELGAKLAQAPAGFHVHPKVEKLLEERAKMARGEKPVDFGMAEALAFASLVVAGTPVRLSGQDSRRGTFNHRHAVLIDVENEGEHLPLANLTPGQARFEIYDSVLSEAAVLGFEYGFSRDTPEALVLWEAQFGDFANGAQILIDQFLAAGEDKWGLLSGLVMLLPHGYEGQGPEHSSARIERYLQLAGEENMVVAQPSTAGQYFHLLRRQALCHWRKPLIVFTPKSGLRNPDACSPLADLAAPRFANVAHDPGSPAGAPVRRILLATGKIVHELRAERTKRQAADVAVLGLEQLYPFPERELAAELARHQEARELVWVQEEPGNMGALGYVMPLLEHTARGLAVRSVKRSPSASPATGSPKAHAFEQKALLNLAFA